MAAHSSKILSRINLNLLHPQGVGQKLPIRFLKWAVAYGRFIVVMVEIVVLVCFVARFKLDADLTSLKEEVNNRVPYLESLVDSEIVTTQTQQRLDLVKTTYAAAERYPKTLAVIASQTPQTTQITNINLEESKDGNSLSFRFTAVTNSNIDVTAFLNGLKANTNLSEITLANISYDQGQINFTIRGVAK